MNASLALDIEGKSLKDGNLTITSNQVNCPNCSGDEVYPSTRTDLTRFPYYTITRTCSRGHTWTWHARGNNDPEKDIKIERNQ